MESSLRIGSALRLEPTGPECWALVADGDPSRVDIAAAGRELSEALPPGSRLFVRGELDADPRSAVAVAGGWSRVATKCFVEADLAGVLRPELPDGWVLESLAQLGNEEFANRMLRASEEDPFEQSTEESAVDDLLALVEYAGEAFDPDGWFAVSDGQEIGVVLPQIHAEAPEQGSIAYLGVVPQRRGQGLGSLLHALGRAFLHERGGSRYVGSTDERNAAMLQVFRKAGLTTARRDTLFHRPAEGDDALGSSGSPDR